MIKVKIKKGDNVKIISGADKGKTGNVLSVNPKTNKVIVEGLKLVKKATKPDSNKDIKGGILSKEMPIDISNVKKVEDA